MYCSGMGASLVTGFKLPLMSSTPLALSLHLSGPWAIFLFLGWGIVLNELKSLFLGLITYGSECTALGIFCFLELGTYTRHQVSDCTPPNFSGLKESLQGEGRGLRDQKSRSSLNPNLITQLSHYLHFFLWFLFSASIPRKSWSLCAHYVQLCLQLLFCLTACTFTQTVSASRQELLFHFCILKYLGHSLACEGAYKILIAE